MTRSSEKFNVAGLGELLWDNFPGGRRPGGAPANVAYHARQLGNNGIVLSRVGDDADGKELIDHLNNYSIETGYIQVDEEHETGTVTVEFDGDEPNYTITKEVAWDYLTCSEQWSALAKSLDAVCFGSLAQRSDISRKAITRFLEFMPNRTLRVLDVNLREPFYNAEILQSSISLCNIIKLNEHELELLGSIFDQDNVILWLLKEMDVPLICLTKGSAGSELISSSKHYSANPVEADTSEGDAVGVGDAFTAALIHNVLRKQPLNRVLEKANSYAGLIVTKQGAMPELSESSLSPHK